MENKNMTAAREWENDPNCFLRMLNSPAQQRSRRRMPTGSVSTTC